MLLGYNTYHRLLILAAGVAAGWVARELCFSVTILTATGTDY